MRLNQYPALLAYANAWHNSAHYHAGSFLTAFLEACVNADGENFELLKPALEIIINKYPAEESILAIELKSMAPYGLDEQGQIIRKIVTPIAYGVVTREILTPERIEREGYKPA